MIEGSGFRRPKNIEPTDPDSDPDPQHCYLSCLIGALVYGAQMRREGEVAGSQPIITAGTQEPE
jgi:hypothetical protein